jgi:hypothetical protein
MYGNWWSSLRYCEDHHSWAIGTSSAYEFGLVMHWTKPSTERQILGSLGFAVEEFLSWLGEAVEGDLSTTRYFYVLARKVSALD